ncbi:MAG TPA: Uma2 family endonuclease [Gemmataceae bacterium]|nr:Uma2 family endonuclease [Gemmataceae bacterium]
MMVATENGTITVADLVERLGGVPGERIFLTPAPGKATEDDLIRLLEGPNKVICELIDGVLVEKALATPEGIMAVFVGRKIGNFADEEDLGLVGDSGSPFRFRLGLVRIPDVSFTSWVRIGADEFPSDPIANLIPDLAVEVLSQANTPAEIELKLDHYFEAGVRLVWIIDPKRQKARAYTSRRRSQEIGIDGDLLGGRVLPGFRLPLKDVIHSTRRRKRKPR